jgi:hypothetical protein
MTSIENSFRAAFLATAVFGCAPASALDTQAAWEGFMVNTGATGCAGVGGSAAHPCKRYADLFVGRVFARRFHSRKWF